MPTGRLGQGPSGFSEALGYAYQSTRKFLEYSAFYYYMNETSSLFKFARRRHSKFQVQAAKVDWQQVAI